MKGLLLLLSAWSLLFNGYQPAPPISTPEPPAAVSPTPETAAPSVPDLSDPNAYVLDRLEKLLDGDRWRVRFWIFPGTGPLSVELPEAEYGEALRDLFSSRDWQATEPPEYDEEAVYPADAYSLHILPSALSPDRVQPVSCVSYDSTLQAGTYDAETGRYGSIYFTAEGAENLCGAIADLYPGWEAVTGCRTRTAPQKTQWATARAYLEDTFTVLREKGHITDARIDSLEVIPPVWDGESVDTNGMAYDDSVTVQFQAKFSLKPTRSELTYWQELGVDKDGWVSYDLIKISLSLCEDGLYEMGWFEGPVAVP